jgi:SnoaL-like domain
MMTTAQLSEWCAAYKRAWETQDADLFVSLFSTDCSYRISPFTEPIPGRAFHAFWRALAEKQQDNQIALEVLAWTSGNRAIVRWDARTTRAGTAERKQGSGIFLLTFDATNRCTEVWEWQHWHPDGAPMEKPAGYEKFNV